MGGNIPAIGASGYLLLRIFLIMLLVALPISFGLVNILEVSTWAIVLAYPDLRKRFVASFRYTGVRVLFLFWAWIAFSAIWSDGSIWERVDDILSWRKLLLVPICMCAFQRARQVRVLVNIFLFCCTCAVVISYLSMLEVAAFDDLNRQLIFKNHSVRGILFAGAAIFAVHQARDTSNLLVKFFLVILAFGLAVYILFFNSGRSGYLFFFVAASVYFSQYVFSRFPVTWKTFAAIACFFTLLGAVISSSEVAVGRFSQALTEITDTMTHDEADMSSVGYRIVMWGNTIDMIAAKPLLGSGAGAFSKDYEKIVLGQEGVRGLVTDDPHQQYLHVAAEYGLLGLAIFSVAIICLLRDLTLSGNYYSTVGIAIVLGICATSLANGHFSSFVEGRFAWIFIATSIVNYRDRT
jgi:O-antigen ligase